MTQDDLARDMYIRYKITELLLKGDATKLIRTPYNRYLFQVIENRHHKIAQLFLDYNADIQFVSQRGDTFLHMAINSQFDVEFIKALLKRRLSVNATNKDLHTPLHIACRFHRNNLSKTEKYIKALLSYKANVNCTDRHLMTPLHFAFHLQKPDIVAVLLENGKNPNVKNDKGQTPLHIVCEQNYNYDEGTAWKCTNDKASSIIKLLLEYQANTKVVDVNGWTPFRLACKTGNDKAIKIL